ncbi:hypothetical protein AB0C13_37345 [Streptomyces sp. NPDC049099]|uniref:hypothetical protein n=1 Tax=Streptomyces sp. NPDC049099 TaxID=3155768 RepID=UPI00344AA73C
MSAPRCSSTERSQTAKPHLRHLATSIAKADKLMGTTSSSLFILSELTVIAGD